MAVLKLTRDFILSTHTKGMSPTYAMSSHKPKDILARKTERKLKFHGFRKVSTSSKFHNGVNSQQGKVGEKDLLH